jgi:sulfite reductase beta subunit-like hemoprotein
MLTAAQLATLAGLSSRFGRERWSRPPAGNVQMHGITDTAAVADAIDTAGQLPSPTRERVRNIVTSPLSGRVGASGPSCGGSLTWTRRSGLNPRPRGCRAASGVVASHLLAGDNRDRSGDPPQRMHDRVRITDGS